MEHLVWFLEDIQGLSSLQFGFRRFRSTADPILCLEHGISAAFENSKFFLAVFFDLQEAYDTTWKRGVLRKLLSLGFCEHLPLFIRNMLVNRFFRVLCFTIPINDIVSAVPDGVSSSLYVGDFVLYSSGSTFLSAVPTDRRMMQLAINRVADWTDTHGFRFSMEKSHAVIFRRTQRVSGTIPYPLRSFPVCSS